ncbi:MAG: hypothetical protein RR977_02200 [Oscillospiraceae bacterium]
MKKILSMILAGALSITMAFGLTSCGNGPTKEQFATIEGMLSTYDTLVADCENEFVKFPAADDELYIENIKKIAGSIDQIKILAADTRKAYEENKKDYTKEDIDDLIEVTKTQLEKGETFKQSIIDGVANANALIEQQAAAQEAE